MANPRLNAFLFLNEDTDQPRVRADDDSTPITVDFDGTFQLYMTASHAHALMLSLKSALDEHGAAEIARAEAEAEGKEVDA